MEMFSLRGVRMRDLLQGLAASSIISMATNWLSPRKRLNETGDWAECSSRKRPDE
jgi:hypothetical protein